MNTKTRIYLELKDYIIIKSGELAPFENLTSHATLKIFGDDEMKVYLGSLNIGFLNIVECDEAKECISQILSLYYPTQRKYDFFYFVKK